MVVDVSVPDMPPCPTVHLAMHLGAVRVDHQAADPTALPLALEARLLARAEGNLFFLEELAYTVREHGAGQPALAVPNTIRAVLAARAAR
jgi:hypothetical protein